MACNRPDPQVRSWLAPMTVVRPGLHVEATSGYSFLAILFNATLGLKFSGFMSFILLS